MKNDKTYLDTYYLVIQSPAIHPYAAVGTLNYFIPIDMNFWLGKAPYEEYLTDRMKSLWMPTLKHQVQTINAIVECSAFVPKYSESIESNWELKYDYNFCFKWGGPQVSENQYKTQQKQDTMMCPINSKKLYKLRTQKNKKLNPFYMPGTSEGAMLQTQLLKECMTTSDLIQMTNLLQTHKAAPQKFQELEQPSKTHKTKKEMHQCLQTLFKKDTFQETQEETDLKQLILQQQQKQHELKYNILQLIAQIKQQQRDLQLQTGLPP